MSIWREPPEESLKLYPGLVVCDNRVAGSITAGRSRVPLWCFVWNAVNEGWAEVEAGWGLTEHYGWTADKMGAFLGNLLEHRGELGRLLLILADVERRERERLGRDDRAWYEVPSQRRRVIDQLKRCLKALELAVEP